MMYKNILIKKRTEFLKKWQLQVIETYPQETIKYLLNEKDEFANPVGAVIVKCFGSIYNELMGEMNPDKIYSALDDFIKIRSVQDCSPLHSLNFIFLLKQIIFDEFKKENSGIKLIDGFIEVNKRIDKIALIAFDLYTKSREKIYALKSDEIKRRSFRIFNRFQATGNTFD